MSVESIDKLELKDKQIICIDCGCTFVFNVGEQRYYKKRKNLSTPRGCSSCRKRRRETLVPDSQVQHDNG
jgi:hypothetical protein